MQEVRGPGNRSFPDGVNGSEEGRLLSQGGASKTLPSGYLAFMVGEATHGAAHPF
jgi:hypothetical protein